MASTERRLGFKEEYRSKRIALSNSKGGRFLELQFHDVEIFGIEFTVEEFSDMPKEFST